MTAPIYKCWTKATNREGGTLRRSHNWITSRRAWFKIFTDRIECGKIIYDSGSSFRFRRNMAANLLEKKKQPFKRFCEKEGGLLTRVKMKDPMSRYSIVPSD